MRDPTGLRHAGAARGRRSSLIARIVLIDDDEKVRNVLAEWLRQRGFAVEEAGGEAEALRAIESASPDVVLLDLGIASSRLFAQIRASDPAPRVIIITGRSHEDAQHYGVFAVLDKPFRMPELERAVRAAVVRVP